MRIDLHFVLVMVFCFLFGYFSGFQDGGVLGPSLEAVALK